MSNGTRSLIAAVITAVIFLVLHFNPGKELPTIPGLAVFFAFWMPAWFVVYWVLGKAIPAKKPSDNA